MILSALIVQGAPQEKSTGSIFDFGFERIAHGMEAVGVVVIVIGGLIATWVFVRQVVQREDFGDAYRLYRAHLGRAILLGLEFLVVGDIIGTVAVELTFHNLGTLAIVVVIRTFLSFALEVEIDGHWPWEDSRHREGGQDIKL